jgi:hypothetical protein
MFKWMEEAGRQLTRQRHQARRQSKPVLDSGKPIDLAFKWGKANGAGWLPVKKGLNSLQDKLNEGEIETPESQGLVSPFIRKLLKIPFSLLGIGTQLLDECSQFVGSRGQYYLTMFDDIG